MRNHRNQMSGKTSFGPGTAADLTDGNILFLVGPCDIFHSDNCQRQSWVIWPRLSTSGLLWHHWVKNGTCEHNTGTLVGKIWGRPLSDIIRICDFSYLEINYFKVIIFRLLKNVFLSSDTPSLHFPIVYLSCTLWSQWGFAVFGQRVICFMLL